MKIAFTSCMNLGEHPQQDVWDRIAAEHPDYLFLLGDQIYMDFFPHLGEPEGWPLTKFDAEMSAKYQAQWNQPQFRSLWDRMLTRRMNDGGVYGTWDDHDFAWNNANGVAVPADKKAIARRLFSQYMQIQPKENGIQYAVSLKHQATIVGKVIFLDTRWYREPAGDNADLLGAEQFEFLRKELDNVPGLIILCAGTPMRGTGKGWVPYRRDYQRFLQLVGDRKIIFLSGDIHENDFLPPSTGTRLFEIISSGAAVTKYKLVGKRENFGVLEYTDSVTRVTLHDRHRRRQVYEINNSTFSYDEVDN